MTFNLGRLIEDEDIKVKVLLLKGSLCINIIEINFKTFIIVKKLFHHLVKSVLIIVNMHMSLISLRYVL